MLFTAAPLLGLSNPVDHGSTRRAESSPCPAQRFFKLSRLFGYGFADDENAKSAYFRDGLLMRTPIEPVNDLLTAILLLPTKLLLSMYDHVCEHLFCGQARLLTAIDRSWFRPHNILVQIVSSIHIVLFSSEPYC